MSIDKTKKHGAGAFVLAGISFIPLIGVVTGVICILNAVIRRVSNSKLLGFLGFAGIMVTVILYGVVLPKVINSESVSKEFEPHAISAMTSLVKNIEFYKLQNGSYPTSMDQLRESFKEGEMIVTFDVSGPRKMGEKQRDFYYEVINNGENYLLFGVGIDDTTFTEDDIFPLIDSTNEKNIGWVKEK